MIRQSLRHPHEACPRPRSGSGGPDWERGRLARIRIPASNYVTLSGAKGLAGCQAFVDVQRRRFPDVHTPPQVLHSVQNDRGAIHRRASTSPPDPDPDSYFSNICQKHAPDSPSPCRRGGATIPTKRRASFEGVPPWLASSCPSGTGRYHRLRADDSPGYAPASGRRRGAGLAHRGLTK